MILVVEHVQGAVPHRQAEYDRCLAENRQASWFTHVELLEGRPTFRAILERVNERFPEQLAVVANADITFDATLQAAANIGPRELLALTRWENETKFYGRKDSQDVWIFRTPVFVVDAPFRLGVPGCDNRIAKLFQDAGYRVRNPSLTIKCYHHHASRVRTYRLADRVPGPYLLLPPTA